MPMREHCSYVVAECFYFFEGQPPGMLATEADSTDGVVGRGSWCSPEVSMLMPAEVASKAICDDVSGQRPLERKKNF